MLHDKCNPGILKRLPKQDYLVTGVDYTVSNTKKILDQNHKIETNTEQNNKNWR